MRHGVADQAVDLLLKSPVLLANAGCSKTRKNKEIPFAASETLCSSFPLTRADEIQISRFARFNKAKLAGRSEYNDERIMVG